MPRSDIDPGLTPGTEDPPNGLQARRHGLKPHDIWKNTGAAAPRHRPWQWIFASDIKTNGEERKEDKQMGPHQTEAFCTKEEPRRPPTRAKAASGTWENGLANRIADKGLMPPIRAELTQLNSKPPKQSD